mmetsp:Transcript_94363/g.270617  ORF Transcript_94363/g.270617 Transcript_94363/m.270617 type:complete len:227 (-) Transcript_94363:667-1347(-)
MVRPAGNEPEERGDDGIGDHEHEALEPVGGPVRDDGEGDQDREDHHRGVHGAEGQVHGLSEVPTHDHAEGHHEERHLSRGAHGDADRDIHLLVHGHADRADVLARIADDGQQDDADESLADAPIFHEAVDGAHQPLRGASDEARGAEEHAHGATRRDACAFFFLIARFALEHVHVREQLKQQKSDVGTQYVQAAPPGDLDRDLLLLGGRVLVHDVRGEDHRGQREG